MVPDETDTASGTAEGSLLMPGAALVDKLAERLTQSAVAGITTDDATLAQLRQEDSLIDVAWDVADLSESELAFLQLLPQTMREGIRAVVARGVALHKAIHFQYSPAYEFGLQVWDYGQGVSVHISGPYPEGTRPDFGDETNPFPA